MICQVYLKFMLLLLRCCLMCCLCFSSFLQVCLSSSLISVFISYYIYFCVFLRLALHVGWSYFITSHLLFHLLPYFPLSLMLHKFVFQPMQLINHDSWSPPCAISLYKKASLTNSCICDWLSYIFASEYVFYHWNNTYHLWQNLSDTPLPAPYSTAPPFFSYSGLKTGATVLTHFRYAFYELQTPFTKHAM